MSRHLMRIFWLANLFCLGCAGNFQNPDAMVFVFPDYGQSSSVDAAKKRDSGTSGTKDIQVTKKEATASTGKDTGSTTSPDIGQSVNACAANFSAAFVYNSNMVICKSSSSQTYNQCNAQSACNTAAGWQFCVASKFLANGGSSTAPDNSAPVAWIKGCNRVNDLTNAAGPNDSACSCLSGTTKNYNQAYYCSNKSLYVQSSLVNLGAVTSTSCFSLGYDSAKSKDGYWNFRQATELLSATVCCK